MNESLKKTNLLKICAELGIKKCSSKNKRQLLELIAKHITPTIVQTRTVLEICPIPINVEPVMAYISRYMASRASYYAEKKRAPFVEDEFAEYYIAKSSGGSEVGGGSCAMDVIAFLKCKIGIDVMCVIMNKSMPNEKSLIQNFSSSGADLDSMFKQRQDKEAVSQYLEQYSHKLEGVKAKHSLEDLYILAFVSTISEIFLVCFKIDMSNIKNVVSGGFVGGESSVNISVSNFVDSAYGTVKLYKSKKRMELRLLPAVLKSKLAVKIYELPAYADASIEASATSKGTSLSAIIQTTGTETALPASL